MKIIILTFWLFLTFLSSGICQSNTQSAADDLNKYWVYRSRFLGHDGNGGFISVGSAQGESIPASMRNIDIDCLRNWGLINSQTPRQEGTGLYKWGDATVHIGYYLAMLALEYKNLLDAKADTRSTVRELYYALKAYERLDLMAEVSLGMEPSLNGFFLRDDVPVDFYQDSENPENRRFKHQEKGGYDCVGSDYCKGTRSVDGGSYVSQDQVTSLLFGFAFVKKFAGDVVYEKGSKEKFGDYAKLYTHLVVSYMEECDWRLESPDGQKISNRWGGDVRAFNALFASAADEITGGMFENNYHKKTFLGRLVKGSYSWAFGLHNDSNYSMIFRLMMLSDQWSPRQMAKRTRKSDKILYALADAVLNDRDLDSSIKKEELESIIKSAPITGPCFGTPDCQAPDGWKSSHLWFHSKHKNGNPYGLTFEYPGIDFMLLYNLFHYYYKEEVPIYKAMPPSPKDQKKPETAGQKIQKVPQN